MSVAVSPGSSISTSFSSFAFTEGRWAAWELHGYLYMSWEKQMRCKEQAVVRTVSKAFSAFDTV